ncbi:MAG: hypothetical protein Q8P67_24820 [archaeon]|nr:hypothetical protein [archaeon]
MVDEGGGEGMLCYLCLGVFEESKTGIVEQIKQHVSRLSYGTTLCTLGVALPVSVTLRGHLVGLDPGFVKRAAKELIEREVLSPLGLSSCDHAPLTLAVEFRHPSSSEADMGFLEAFGLSTRSAARAKGQPRPARRISQSQLAISLAGNAALRAHLAEHAPALLRVPILASQRPEVAVSALHSPVVVAGRYAKLARGVSQTEWSVKGKKLAAYSVAELVAPAIAAVFGALGDANGITWNFLGSGREDADVRMLGPGRPFIVEILNPRLTTFEQAGCTPQQLQDRINANCFLSSSHLQKEQQPQKQPQPQPQPQQPDQFESNFQQQQPPPFSSSSSSSSSPPSSPSPSLSSSPCPLILDDPSLPLVQITGLQQISLAQRKAFTNDDAEVRKTYACLIWVSRPVEELDLPALHTLAPFSIRQQTPLRVLHRRAPGFRQKMIHSLSFAPFDDHHLLVTVCTEGGAYIKEFVHGDHGRTTPNIGSLLHCQADILTLDVLDVHMNFPPSIPSIP